jgi:hypothetical protein
MKTISIKKTLLSLFAVSAAILSRAQVNYNFNKCMLISGNEKRQGAVYRISSVKSDIDAIITIDKVTSSASLDSFTISENGYASLQPAFSIAPRSWGYVQFNIQFVRTGTFIPVTMVNIPARGKSYGNNYKDVKLDVLANSASSFKLRMYSVNYHGYALQAKADLHLQEIANENNDPAEAAVAKLYQ